MIRGLIAVTSALVALVACSDDDAATTTTTTERHAAETRLIVAEEATDTSATARHVGTLLADKCVVIGAEAEKLVLVWPKGTTVTEDGVKVGDTVYGFGERVVLGGGEVPAADLSDLGADDCGPSTAWIVGDISKA